MKNNFPSGCQSSGLSRIFIGILIAFFHLPFLSVKGQSSIADSSIKLAFLDITFSSGANTGAWSDHAPLTNTIGLDAGIKISSNYYLLSGISFLFSDRIDSIVIRETLGGILVSDEFLVTNEGILTPVDMSVNGWTVPLAIGKIFPMVGPNDNSGLFLELGAQYLRYKYQFRTPEGDVGLLVPPYESGYDRLRDGFGLRESIGYRHFSNSGYTNFVIGFHFGQNWIQERRGFFFPSGPTNTGTVQDFFWGFRIAWSYPIFNKAPDKVYYY